MESFRISRGGHVPEWTTSLEVDVAASKIQPRNFFEVVEPEILITLSEVADLLTISIWMKSISQNEVAWKSTIYCTILLFWLGEVKIKAHFSNSKTISICKLNFAKNK